APASSTSAFQRMTFRLLAYSGGQPPWMPNRASIADSESPGCTTYLLTRPGAGRGPATASAAAGAADTAGATQAARAASAAGATGAARAASAAGAAGAAGVVGAAGVAALRMLVRMVVL